jgi:hypothetical protein
VLVLTKKLYIGPVVPNVKVEVITSKYGNYRTSGTLCYS